MYEIPTLVPAAVLIAACTIGMVIALPILVVVAVRANLRRALTVVAVATGLALCAIVASSILAIRAR